MVGNDAQRKQIKVFIKNLRLRQVGDEDGKLFKDGNLQKKRGGFHAS